MNLRPDEELLLEVSEDFTIVAADTSTDVQVKNSQAAKGPRPFSLQSAEVASVLDRYWIASNEGMIDRRVIFLARGGAACERDHDFPGGLPGLSYWRSAALDSDTQPLRAALLDILKGTSLGRWIASSPSDAELRSRLLRRVQWQLNSSSDDELSAHLRDQASEFFHFHNLPVTTAPQAVNSLTALVFATAAKPQSQDRRLTQLDLLRTLEEVAGTFLVGQRMVAAPRATESNIQPVLVTELGGLSLTTVARAETVEELIPQIRGQPLVWIHGANGVGKSTLARLIGQRLCGRWLEFDLRPVQKDAVGSLAAWRELIRAMARTTPLDGIIVDDFDDDAAIALRSRLSALAQMLSTRGVRIVVTSHRAPSPAYLLECGSAANASIQAPYFSEADVTAFISAMPAPAKELIPAWTVFIRVATGGGHPLLTAAKVSSLRTRGWPNAALAEDVVGRPSSAIQLSRDDARRSLMKDLSELDQARSLDAGNLLRRIGCVFDRVDEDLVRKLYRDPPALPNGGDALAVLRGTWLEAMPDGDLRISPLLADIVADVPVDKLRQWRSLAAEYWLSKRVLDERTLPLCFWNAFLGEHTGVLLILFQLLNGMPKEKLRGAAALLSPMTALATDRPLFAANPAVAANLRLMQFEVAEALEEGTRAGEIAPRLVEEINAIEQEDIRILLMHIAISKILMAEFAEITSADRITYALIYRELEPKVLQISGDHFPDRSALVPPKLLDADLDAADILFAGIVRHIKSSSDQLDAFGALDAISAPNRNRFIDAMSEVYEGHSVFVHSGWSGDQIAGRDMNVALTMYDKIEAIAAKWDRPDVSIEIACACSVIFDEGLGLFEKSIAVIDGAMAVYGAAPSLVRQKSKVLGHAGRDLEAIELLLKIEDDVGKESAFDRSLALRDGALSAARSGRFDDAVRLLDKARTSLEGVPDRRPLAAGILVEKALVLWRAGSRADAIRSAADALDAVEAFSLDVSRQAERSHQYARAIVGLFFSEIDNERADARPPFIFGQASALEAETTKLQGVDLKPLADNWRILAVVEVAMNIDVGIGARSMQKQSGLLAITIELMLRQKRYEHALRSANIMDALRAGLEVVWAGKLLRETKRDHDEMLRATASEFIFSLDAHSLLGDSVLREMAESVLLDIISYWTAVSGETIGKELLNELRRSSESLFGEDAGFEAILDLASGDNRVGPSDPMPMIYASAFAISRDAVESDPAVRFHRDMMVLGRLATASFARAVLSTPIITKMAESWGGVVEQQSFRLRNPGIHVPEIEAALKKMAVPSLQNAAALLLAVAPAVAHSFGPGWEELLRRVASDDSAGFKSNCS